MPSLGPSSAVVGVRDEWALGVPPVGPYKGMDFTAVLRTASVSHRHSGPVSDGPLARALTGNADRETSTHGPSLVIAPVGPLVSALNNQPFIPPAGQQANVPPGSSMGRVIRAEANTVQRTNSGMALMTAGAKPEGDKISQMVAQMVTHSQDLHTLSAAARTALQHHMSRSSQGLTWAQQQAAKAQANPSARLQSSGSVTPALPPNLAQHVDSGQLNVAVHGELVSLSCVRPIKSPWTSHGFSRHLTSSTQPWQTGRSMPVGVSSSQA